MIISVKVVLTMIISIEIVLMMILTDQDQDQMMSKIVRTPDHEHQYDAVQDQDGGDDPDDDVCWEFSAERPLHATCGDSSPPHVYIYIWISILNISRQKKNANFFLIQWYAELQHNGLKHLNLRKEAFILKNAGSVLKANKKWDGVQFKKVPKKKETSSNVLRCQLFLEFVKLQKNKSLVKIELGMIKKNIMMMIIIIILMMIIAIMILW